MPFRVSFLGGRYPVDVQVGDEVLSKVETDGTIAYKPVTTTFTREADKIYRVGIGDQTVSVTAENPFYVHNIGWVRVDPGRAKSNTSAEIRQMLISHTSKRVQR
jgi:hypothetical protein